MPIPGFDNGYFTDSPVDDLFIKETQARLANQRKTRLEAMLGRAAEAVYPERVMDWVTGETPTAIGEYLASPEPPDAARMLEIQKAYAAKKAAEQKETQDAQQKASMANMGAATEESLRQVPSESLQSMTPHVTAFKHDLGPNGEALRSGEYFNYGGGSDIRARREFQGAANPVQQTPITLNTVFGKRTATPRSFAPSSSMMESSVTTKPYVTDEMGKIRQETAMANAQRELEFARMSPTKQAALDPRVMAAEIAARKPTAVQERFAAGQGITGAGSSLEYADIKAKEAVAIAERFDPSLAQLRQAAEAGDPKALGAYNSVAAKIGQDAAQKAIEEWPRIMSELSAGRPLMPQ